MLSCKHLIPRQHSLGQVEIARKHICFSGHQPDPVEMQKLQLVEKHLSKCSEARGVGDWRGTLREADAAIASGADASPQVHKSTLNLFIVDACLF